MISEVEKQRIRAVSRGISNKSFNDKVNDRYAGNDNLLDTLLIQEFDTIPEIVNKKIDFFFTFDNYTSEVKEKLVMRNKGNAKEYPLLPWMVLHLKFKERYTKDRETGELKPLGQRRIKISNINELLAIEEEIKKRLNGFTVKYGNKWITYNFKNGKEIRLEHQSDRQAAINLIELVLPLTVKEYQHEGTIQDNVFNVNPPKNTPKLDTDGLIGHVFKVTIHKQEGNKTNKLNTIYISNSISKNKY